MSDGLKAEESYTDQPFSVLMRRDPDAENGYTATITCEGEEPYDRDGYEVGMHIIMGDWVKAK